MDMIELDFTVPPQVMVGVGAFGDGWPVSVMVTAGETAGLVRVELSAGRAPARRVLAEDTRVLRTEDAILAWLSEHGPKVGAQLDKEHLRDQRLLHG